MIKISINKLAEFLADSNAARRQRIVQDQIDPKAFIVTYYEDAKKGIISQVCNPTPSKINNLISALNKKVTYSDTQIKSKQCSIDALNTFNQLAMPNLSQYILVASNKEQQSVMINNVRININPDIIIEGNKKGKKVIGAIKFHISKSNALNDEGMLYSATMLHNYLEQLHGNDPNIIIDRSLCFSVDIFQQKFEVAPTTYKRKLNEIIAGCNQYALIWNSLTSASR